MCEYHTCHHNCYPSWLNGRMRNSGKMKGDSEIKVVEAIQSGDMDLLQDLHRSGVFDVNAYLYNGETPLGFSIRQQKLEVVNLLLNIQADVTKPSLIMPVNPFVSMETSQKVFPLQIAINTKNTAVIERVFDSGPSLKYCNNSMMSLLHLAVQKKAYSLVKKVVEMVQDEDMCQVSSLDLSEPLKVAVIHRDSKMVQLLIHLGANVNREHDGMVPLVYAANNMDLRMCLFLMNSGAILNNTGGLLRMSQSPLSYAIRASLEDAVSMLLKLGADPNTVAEWSTHGVGGCEVLLAGSSMLHLAIAKGSLSIVRQLVSAGAMLDNTDNEGNVPLHLACQVANNQTEIVRYLVNMKEQSEDRKHLEYARILHVHVPTINAQNKKGITPLMVAVLQKNEEVLKILLECSPDFNLYNTEQKTALHIAVESDFQIGVLLLLGAGCNVDGGMTKGYRYTPLHLAVKENNSTLVKLLMEKAATLALLTSAKETLLHLAVTARSDQFTKLFLDKGLDVNAKTSSWETPLMLAVRQDNLDVCRLLMEAGALLDARDKNKETALSLSVYFGFEANARLLISNGADLNLADKRKTTPLYWSIFNCRIKTLKLLLLAGVRLTVKELYRYPKNLSIMRNKSLVKWIVDTLRNLPTLQDLCRRCLRNSLVSVAGNQAIGPRVEQLPLPKRMQQFLMYETLDLDSEDSDVEDEPRPEAHSMYQPLAGNSYRV